MNIITNAMDINLEGNHTFDNLIDYRLNFYLSDLLTTEEADRSVKGKTRVFLKMHGTVDNPEFSYDKNAAKEGVKTEINNEATTVKTILNEEFGLFENDTSVNNASPINEEKLDFTIEWEEENDSTIIESKKPSSKTKGLKNIIKNSNKSEKKEELDFEDDDF